METIRKKQSTRYELGKTIPGTRGFHYFYPLSTNEIAFKRVSIAESYSGTFSFVKPVIVCPSNIKVMDFLACKYDGNWWIGMVLEISNEEKDFQIKFFHPSGPAKNFYWPSHDDICWVPFSNCICQLSTPSTSTGRMYTIDDDEYAKVLSLV